MVLKKSTVERIVLLYVVFASLWVFVIDLMPGLLNPDQGVGNFLRIYQGTGFVVFSGILVYVLLLASTRPRGGEGSSLLPRERQPEAAAAASQAALQAARHDLDTVVERWSQAIEQRSQETAEHCRRLAEMTGQLGALFGLTDGELSDLRRGAYLHDLGKIAVPDQILLKNGPLNDAERRAMQQHPQVGYDLLAGIPSLRRASEIPYSHHERWDGTGYPRGLKGKEIPLAARLFAVVEVWEVLTSDRPFRKALPARAAITYIRCQSGTQFDPQVVEKFLQLSSITALRYDEGEGT